MKRRTRGNALLTPRDVARLLGVHVNTVRRWTNEGILQAYRIGSRSDRKFLEEDVTRFLIEQTEKVEKANKE